MSEAKPNCRGCGKPIDLAVNGNVCDGCPCNNRAGINHGLVPENICVCEKCDPQRTGGPRPAPKVMFREFI